MTIELRTARLTILIDPRKKAVFERLCAEDDVTPSQMVRKFIRAYIEGKTGRPWRPEDEPPPPGGERTERAARGQRRVNTGRGSKQGSTARRGRTVRSGEAVQEGPRAPSVR